MRPQTIELAGFGSFRDATTIDLDDVDLFVLSGPTGSGKSTVLDAAIFALYGCVPRYGMKDVAPAINQGRNEAKVRLTFALDGRTYAATRVVRRTTGGRAATKEARLEDVTGGGQQVLAGSAKEVTEHVQRLVGLSFEQFARSVVLPQGAFDQFLFAKPSERADLLVQLLDLGVYEEVGKRARAAAGAAEARAVELTRRLEGELATATPEARDQAAARVDTLRVLLVEVQQAEADLAAIVEEGRTARERAERAQSERDALVGLSRPDGLDTLTDRLRVSAETLRQAEEALGAAVAAREAAEDQQAELPDPGVLERLHDLDMRLARHAQAMTSAEQALATATAEQQAASSRQQQAEAAVATAREQLEEARRHEAATALVDGLSVGAPCPVCERPLDDLPEHDRSRIDAATAALTTAEAALERARQSHTDAAAAVARAQQSVDGAAEQASHDRDEHARLLATHGLPADADAQERLRAKVTEVADRVDQHRRAERDARAAVDAARQAARELQAAEREAWAAFDVARDRVAVLGPPAAERDDLARCWDDLLSWATDRLPAATAAATEAAEAVAQVEARWRERNDRLRAQVRAADVPLEADATASLAVAQELASATHRRDRLEEALRTVGQLRDDLTAARQQQAVASSLGDYLRADKFERWLLARALRVLVEGGSRILRELSSGAYSLALDERNEFLVVDHRNADEPRTARSLSGGERFLASLSLALALADHVAELAAEGAPRLESLFLDEGFGTLDADTLDVVAAAIEELGARGRMVGIITHVRDLAERVPVRFDVRRGPTGSVVERRDQGTGDEDAA